MNTLSYLDDWEEHKDDFTVWRRFWALWELRRKWKWADWFYTQLDRSNDEIVEPKAWSLFPGESYMKLCLWIALLRSVHEGMTKGLDSFSIPDDEKVKISDVLPPIPHSISEFPKVNVGPFKDFRNAVFHCNWSPTIAKFQLDDEITTQIELLHKNIGVWINKEFRIVFVDFKIKYAEFPMYWIFGPDGEEFQPELFY
jgi:hypothetical protein